MSVSDSGRSGSVGAGRLVRVGEREAREPDVVEVALLFCWLEGDCRGERCEIRV